MSGSRMEPPPGTHLHIERRVLPNSGPKEDAKIFGIFGIDGSGKIYLMKQLKKILGDDLFAFYTTSELLIRGDMTFGAFMTLSEDAKKVAREVACTRTKAECTASEKIGVVAGHYICWDESQVEGNIVCTQKALDIFTHILYLNTPIEIITEFREAGPDKERSIAHLTKWQEKERTQLQDRCRESNIPFTILPLPDGTVPKTILDLCTAMSEPQSSS